MTRTDSNEDGDARRDALSIGALAEATGMSVDALRVWERRYGWPKPERLPSGHRRYDGAIVPRLRRLVALMAQGHRPGSLLKLDDDALASMERIDVPDASGLDALLVAAETFDEAGILSALEAESHSRSALSFVSEIVAPLMQTLGMRWADGTMGVHHGHFVSQLVGSFLMTNRPHASGVGAPNLVAACLPGDLHDLGVRMLAFVASGEGARVHVLGADTPLESIAFVATQTCADTVAISVSAARGGVDADRRILELRSMLPAGTRLVVGGAGTQSPRRAYAHGVEKCEDLAAFASSLSRRAAA